MFETSVSPTAPLNLDIEYQNADLWGLWGGANAPRAPPPGYGPGEGECRYKNCLKGRGGNDEQHTHTQQGYGSQ